MSNKSKNLKLKRLDAGVASQKFDTLYEYIQKALPSFSSKKAAFLKGNFQKAVVSGSIECWLAYILDEDEQMELVGVVTTSFVREPLSGEKVLLIYTIGGERDQGSILPAFYKQGFEQIKSYASLNNCKGVTLYTEQEAIVRLIKGLDKTSKLTYVVNVEV